MRKKAPQNGTYYFWSAKSARKGRNPIGHIAIFSPSRQPKFNETMSGFSSNFR
jgi:malate synthase